MDPITAAMCSISIALDDLANVYVSGFVASGGASDFVTIKYDTTGTEQWVQLYNGPGNSYDGAYVIAVDNNRDVLVTGLQHRSRHRL